MIARQCILPPAPHVERDTVVDARPAGAFADRETPVSEGAPLRLSEWPDEPDSFDENRNDDDRRGIS